MLKWLRKEFRKDVEDEGWLTAFFATGLSGFLAVIYAIALTREWNGGLDLKLVAAGLGTLLTAALFIYCFVWIWVKAKRDFGPVLERILTRLNPS